ncbi:MAG: hypothetical protein ACFNOO_07950, partial [Segatella oulorum]
AACADDDLATDKSNKHTGTALAFNVSDMQMDALAQNPTGQTRGLSLQPIPAAYFAPRKIEATGSNPHDFCLIESTVEGLNPVKVDAKTRGTILTAGTLGTFSSIGYRAASSAAAANPSTALLWFHGEKTNPDGTLQSRYDWDWPVNVYGRFYAVSPEATAANGITLSPSSYALVPYVDFEVKQDVKQQKDLMTACSGEVHYEHGNDPTSNLKFTHALAAVKFSIGSNLSPVTITKIELTNVKYKGRYKLPNKADGSGATWTSDNATTTMTLDNINMNTAEMPNTMLAGALNPATNPNNRAGRDAYTFLMIPQTLPNKSDVNHAKVTIYYEEGGSTKHISFPLTGEWKPNTTREYKLSQKNSSWDYQLTLTDNSKTFDYKGNALGSAQFQVKSYRQAPDGTTPQPIPWKISKYEEWDYATNSWVDKGTTKPAWLGDLTDQGNGSPSAEAGNAAVKPATVVDKLPAYNQVLKDATPKGTAANPYNLANPGGNGSLMNIEESANCYLISAPGYYCIPLVYGNAIKNGITNSHAYQTSASGTNVLQHFKDHAGVDIASPYINVQNASNPATQASIVWTDQSGIIEASSLGIEGSGTNAFVRFRVPQDKIKNGNAVIAVKNASGTVMWSWHLWFIHDDALNTVTCTNFQDHKYKFTQETLGWKYTAWSVSTYSAPRKVRVKVEQTIANGGTKQFAYITITQNPGNARQGYSTLYQFGRKDAFPGTDAGLVGTFTPNGGDNMSIQNGIQHPETFYTYGSTWYSGYNQYNLWSMNNTTTGYNDNSVVKTIYDPCPAGFHMPASNAFTGFTTNGQNFGSKNVSGAWDYGFNFNNKISSPDATVYFPASGSRNNIDGSLYNVGSMGFYWSAVPNGANSGCDLFLSSSIVSPQGNSFRSFGFSVRPVAEPKTRVTPKTPGSTEEDWSNNEDIDGGEIEI